MYVHALFLIHVIIQECFFDTLDIIKDTVIPGQSDHSQLKFSFFSNHFYTPKATFAIKNNHAKWTFLLAQTFEVRDIRGRLYYKNIIGGQNAINLNCTVHLCAKYFSQETFT